MISVGDGGFKVVKNGLFLGEKFLSARDFSGIDFFHIFIITYGRPEG